MGRGQWFKQACLEAEGGADVEIGVKRDCLWARVVWIKLSGGREWRSTLICQYQPAEYKASTSHEGPTHPLLLQI